MESYVLFLLLGLGAGAVYAILGLGLVLEYRSSGVINFAQGALAMFIAYVYIGLRETGELMLPVVGIPHNIAVFSSGIGTAPAFLLSLLYAAILGLAVYLVIFRPLRHSSPLARLVASVGLMITVQAIIVLNLGDNAFNISGQSAGNILPNQPVEVLGTLVPRDRFYLAGLTAVIGLLLWALFRFTTFGLATRAAAESEKGAAVCGYSSTRLGAANWIIATVLAGGAGILIVPISGIQPTTFTLFVVPALGAALVGRLNSFSITLIAGLVIGMAQSEITKLTVEFSWLPKSGLQDGLPFLVIIVALVFLGRSIPWRNALVDRAMPAAGRPRHITAASLLSLAAGVTAFLVFDSTLRLGLIQSLITVIVGLSLVVVTGLAGQISLAQMAFAGFGGFVFGILAQDLGIPFPLSLVLAALATAPLAVVVGLPALRTAECTSPSLPSPQPWRSTRSCSRIPISREVPWGVAFHPHPCSVSTSMSAVRTRPRSPVRHSVSWCSSSPSASGSSSRSSVAARSGARCWRPGRTSGPRQQPASASGRRSCSPSRCQVSSPAWPDP